MVILKSDPLPPGHCPQTHHVRPVTFFIFVDVSQGCQRGRERRFRFGVGGGWLELFWRERTKAWQALLACLSGTWVRKGWWQSTEWDSWKGKDPVAQELLSGTDGLQRPRAKPRAAAPSYNSHRFLTRLNVPWKYSELFVTVVTTLHFLVVPFLCPCIMDQRHCVVSKWSSLCLQCRVTFQKLINRLIRVRVSLLWEAFGSLGRGVKIYLGEHKAQRGNDTPVNSL